MAPPSSKLDAVSCVQTHSNFLVLKPDYNPLITTFVTIAIRVLARVVVAAFHSMAVEEASQSQAPLRYMTVPEKIELGGGVGTRDLPGGGGRYRPMKVQYQIYRGWKYIQVL